MSTDRPRDPAPPAPRVLLLEFINADQFPGQISKGYPFAMGWLHRRGFPARWIRFGLSTLHFYRRGADTVGLDPGPREHLLEAVRAWQPDHLFSSHALDPDLLDRVDALRPGLAGRVVVGRIQEVDRVLEPDPATEPSLRFLQLRELDREDFRPDYRWEAGNAEAGRPDRNNVYVLQPGECGYRKPLSDNPRYAGVPLGPAARVRGCAFCGVSQVEMDRGSAFDPLPGPEGSGKAGRWIERQVLEIARSLMPDRRPHALILEAMHDPSLLRRAFDAMVRTGMARDVRLLFASRADHFRRALPVVQELLPRAREAGVQLGVVSCGLESFDDETLGLFHKGTRGIQSLWAANRLMELWQDTGGRFTVDGLSLILFHPWTRLEDLQREVGLVEALGLEAFIGNLLEARMRLHPDLAMTALAAHEGLLEDGDRDPVVRMNQRKLFGEEVAWRFRDPRLGPVCRIVLRLELPPEDQRDGLVDAVRVDPDAEHRVRRRRLVRLFRALVDAARRSPDPLPEADLLERARAEAAAREAAAEAPRPFRLGDRAATAGEVAEALATVVAGHGKPCATLEGLSAEALAQAREALAGRPGVAFRALDAPGGTATLVLAADPALLARRVEVQRVLQGGGPGEALRAARRQAADLDGVPACCAAAWVDRGRRDVDLPWEVLAAAAAAPAGERPAVPLPLLVPDLGFVPCRAACPEASARLGAWLAGVPGLADLREGRRGVVAALDRGLAGDLASFLPGDADGTGLAFAGATVRGSDPGRVRGLRDADRLESPPGQLRALAGGAVREAWTAEAAAWPLPPDWDAEAWGEVARGALRVRDRDRDEARAARAARALPEGAVGPGEGGGPGGILLRPGSLQVRFRDAGGGQPDRLFAIGRAAEGDALAFRRGDAGLAYAPCPADEAFRRFFQALRQAVERVGEPPSDDNWPRWRQALAEALRGPVLQGWKCTVSRLP